MKKPDRSITELQALRERLSGLTEASLRINESLDFNTVLNGLYELSVNSVRKPVAPGGFS